MHRTEIARQVWGSTGHCRIVGPYCGHFMSHFWRMEFKSVLQNFGKVVDLWFACVRACVRAFEGSIEVMTSLNRVVLFCRYQVRWNWVLFCFIRRAFVENKAAFSRHRSRMLFKTDVCVWRNNLYKERIFWRAFFCTSTNQHENAREMCKEFHIKLFFRCNKSKLFPCVQVISKHKNKLLFLSAGSSTCREAIAGTLPCRMITSYVSKRK